jgi:hypothetical protein
VASREEAACSYAVLVRDSWPTSPDKILATLEENRIAVCFREIVNTKPTINILGIHVAGPKSTFEFEIRVLRPDLARATALISNAL